MLSGRVLEMGSINVVDCFHKVTSKKKPAYVGPLVLHQSIFCSDFQ